jgi:putative zinc finger/helix-turn-helix YgiT family protein
MTKFCPNCEEYRGTKIVERRETYDVRGRKITVTVEDEVCKACGEGIGSDEHDQKVLDTLHAEYRRQVGMLTPEQIMAIRRRYRLSQRSFAALLGMSEATINRYENGALQEHTHDNLIRACENAEYVHDLLQRRGWLLSDWQRRRAEEAVVPEGQRGRHEPTLMRESSPPYRASSKKRRR